MLIQPIVEGHGEVAAFPVLLRRLVEEAQVWSVGIGRPIRRSRYQLVQKAEVELAVRLALLQPDCAAILILFDRRQGLPGGTGAGRASLGGSGCGRRAVWSRHRASGI